MPFESFDRQPDNSSASSIQWGDLAGVYTMRPESNGRYTVDAGTNQLSTSYYSETVSGGNGGVYFETIRGNGPYTSYSTGSWDNRDFYGSRYDVDPYMNRWDPRYSYIDPYMDRWDPRYSNIDQGIYDPRFNQDPRYAYDPRYSQDPRYAYDPRYSQDPRYAYDPRYSQDPRYAYDPRLNNRNTDYRYQWGGNRWDPRVSGDYRYQQYQQQGRPYFDPRQRQLEQMYRPGGNVADFMVNQMQAQIQRRAQEQLYRQQQENYYRQQQMYQQQQAYRQPYDYRQQQNDAYRQQQIEQYRRQQQYDAYVRSQQQQQQRYDGYRQQVDPRQQQYDAYNRQQQTEAYRREQYENYMRQQQGQNGYRDNGYYDPRNQGRYQPQQQGDGAWARLSSTVQGMVGHSTLEYNRNVPENLGCATFVSAALSRAYGLPIKDTGVASLESTIKKNNFQQVSLDQIRPGDVIIGHRGPGDYGHAAIYMGDGQIANNNSGKRRVSIDSVNKFNNPSFKQVRAYRYVGDVSYA